jgi:MYXO-CTERM domain-containing protein
MTFLLRRSPRVVAAAALALVLPVGAARAAPSKAPSPCGFPRFARDLALAPRAPASPAPPLDGVLAVRDAWGSYPNELVGQRFVIKWGNSGAVTRSEVDALMAAFDAGWTGQVDQMGHPAPDGTDAYYFNVYIADTGNDTPPSYGAGGYYYRDPDGYPYIVIARSSLYYPEYVEAAAVHELYHAMQDETASYSYDGADAWYWEATAEWASGEVLPENPSYLQFLYGFAYNTQLSVEFFDYPDEGLLTEYHQYGAFVFPRYVSEHALDAGAVVRTWTAPAADTPLGSLRAELQAAGLPLADAFADFAARNALWDYADGSLYADNVDYADTFWPGEEHVIADVGPAGTNAAWSPDPADLPRQWGYNVIEVRAGRGGSDLRVSLDPTGSAGSDADWRVSLAWGDGADVATVAPLTVVDGVATGEVLPDGTVWVVVAAVPDEARSDETFAYTLTVTPNEPATPEDELPGDGVADDGGEEPGGCGCSAGGGGGVPGLAALVVAGVVARRRRKGPPGGA